MQNLPADLAPYDRFFPDGFSLETHLVELRMMRPDDYEAFRPLVQDESIWTWFTRNLARPGELQKWVDDALEARRDKTRVPLTIIDKAENKICGSTSYLNLSFYDKRLEIGATWLGSAFMGTGVNLHAKFMLLSHAFDVLGMERVEVKTDVLNERARKSLLRLGLQEEAVLRSHMLMFDDRRRDTIYYSLLREEWPVVKKRIFGGMI